MSLGGQLVSKQGRYMWGRVVDIWDVWATYYNQMGLLPASILKKSFSPLTGSIPVVQ